MSSQRIRVLVIDDSAYNRQTITSMLAAEPSIEVVARAGDGNEGLRQVFEFEPDVITLDLEMPRMDGFTFLRILMSRRPTPVVVISSYARRENVFKALELGALDFIAKPTQTISPELKEIGADLVDKIKLIGKLRQVALGGRPAMPTPSPPAEQSAPVDGPLRVVCIGASTGGPPALKQVFGAFPANIPAAIVVSQHMPATFTGPFAERLNRSSAVRVREASDGDRLRPGAALVAPGSGSMTFVRDSSGDIFVKIEPLGDDQLRGSRARYVPSIDRMFESAAEVIGANAMGVVLTGMGDDGSRGIQDIKRAGGVTVAESADTAVIFGMPDEAIRTGAVDEILPLGSVAAAIVRFGNGENSD